LRNIHIYLLAGVLTLLAGSLFNYKVNYLKLPVKPAAQSQLWTIEARVAYKPTKGPSKIELLLPKQMDSFLILNETFVSGRYGLNMEKSANNRIAQWALRRPKGEQALYYRMQIIPDDRKKPAKDSAVDFPPRPVYSDMMGTVVEALLEEVRNKSADIQSYTQELLVQLNNKNGNIELLHQGAEKADVWVTRIISILHGARIPTRKINLLTLQDGVKHGKLIPWLQVHNGKQWLTFNPKTGEQGLPGNSLIWNIGDTPLLSVTGGKSAKIEFSIYKETREAASIALQMAKKIDATVFNFSLFNLPVHTQNIYRVLLMIPFGVLLMVLLRNVIGVKSFGTFMPVLIALAFRETDLLWGIVLFTTLIGIGLLFRFYLEYLQLLLVPRLAAVLIIVIILMLLISLLSQQLGIERGLSVALFPMVIIAMTIERMSLVWEELGAGEALKQGFGSLAVAALAYLLMTNSHLEHLIFVFPELLLLMLAITLLLGRYTGYRLTELWRFRAMLKE
jgi:hypothetical protein